MLKENNTALTEEASTVRRWSMACVALRLVSLAITESERRLPSIIDALEAPVAKLGLDKERFHHPHHGPPTGGAFL